MELTHYPSPTKLLNYLTSPDTVIWSALIASAAVPGILNPVVLMQKLKDGKIVPWNWGSKFKDGSLRVDIPLQALNLYFNGGDDILESCVHRLIHFSHTSGGLASKPACPSVLFCTKGVCRQTCRT
jgi:predicted acylesterase/phospholipase RssA